MDPMIPEWVNLFFGTAAESMANDKEWGLCYRGFPWKKSAHALKTADSNHFPPTAWQIRRGQESVQDVKQVGVVTLHTCIEESRMSQSIQAIAKEKRATSMQIV